MLQCFTTCNLSDLPLGYLLQTSTFNIYFCTGKCKDKIQIKSRLYSPTVLLSTFTNKTINFLFIKHL